jgi:ABC-2 type transport system ATP-binding protein
MKQRLKYVFAALSRPAVLILDEPTNALDADGIAVVREIVEQQQRTGIVIVATNSEAEASWCTQRLRLEIPGRS